MSLSLAIILRFSYSLSYPQNRIINNNLIFGLVRHLCPCISFHTLAFFLPSHCLNCLFSTLYMYVYVYVSFLIKFHDKLNEKDAINLKRSSIICVYVDVYVCATVCRPSYIVIIILTCISMV